MVTCLSPAAGGAEPQPHRKWAPFATTLAIDGSAGIGRFPGREDGSLDELDLGDARASGLSAVILTLAPNGFPRYGEVADARVNEQLAYWEGNLTRHPEAFARIATGADLARAKRDGKVGLILGFQDSSPIGEDLERVAMFQRRGVRVIQLTHNPRNLVGDGCMEPGNAGLSAFGHQVVEQLNAHRILVDVAHGGRRTTAEGIAASKAPVLISHTGCAALADVPRCTTDQSLKAMADRGGVAGIVFWPYLSRKEQPTSEHAIRHIEHAINVCGEDHVGIGTDGSISAVNRTAQFERENRELIARLVKENIFDSGRPADLYFFLPDLNHVRRFETLGAMLSARGHSDARIEKILGGNFARVMAEVWG
ncbi:dipeptidase [Peristeroidobacter soli]|uniref:dipeptidase n=1 Tax=Peristeroidobacter soli TaxID=2497877 RepID=UPI001C37832D|nr:membrane dipeptidase [Peristeroidobacter soli]